MKAALRPIAMVDMRTGSWSMALPGGRGGAQDWRGSGQNDGETTRSG